MGIDCRDPKTIEKEIKQRFVRDLMENVKSREDFLTVVRFGLRTLLDDQDIFIEVLCNEAHRAVPNLNNRQTYAAEIAGILEALNIKLVFMSSKDAG